MERIWQSSARLLLAAVAVALAGCGRGGAERTGVADYAKVRAMSDMYGAYVADHKNQPPPSEQAFRDWLGTKQENLQRAGLTVDDMFVSPRGGQPLEWVYGRKPPSGPYGMSYVGYEKTPSDGRRLVIATRGMFEEMDEAQFRKIFRNKP